jgi:hypothetical protein
MNGVRTVQIAKNINQRNQIVKTNSPAPLLTSLCKTETGPGFNFHIFGFFKLKFLFIYSFNNLGNVYIFFNLNNDVLRYSTAFPTTTFF